MFGVRVCLCVVDVCCPLLKALGRVPGERSSAVPKGAHGVREAAAVLLSRIRVRQILSFLLVLTHLPVRNPSCSRLFLVFKS